MEHARRLALGDKTVYALMMWHVAITCCKLIFMLSIVTWIYFPNSCCTCLYKEWKYLQLCVVPTFTNITHLLSAGGFAECLLSGTRQMASLPSSTAATLGKPFAPDTRPVCRGSQAVALSKNEAVIKKVPLQSVWRHGTWQSDLSSSTQPAVSSLLSAIKWHLTKG